MFTQQELDEWDQVPSTDTGQIDYAAVIVGVEWTD